jgi:hypothetical protein
MFKSCYPNSNVDAGAEPGDPVGDPTVPNYQASIGIRRARVVRI